MHGHEICKIFIARRDENSNVRVLGVSALSSDFFDTLKGKGVPVPLGSNFHTLLALHPLPSNCPIVAQQARDKLSFAMDDTQHPFLRFELVLSVVSVVCFGVCKVPVDDQSVLPWSHWSRR